MGWQVRVNMLVGSFILRWPHLVACVRMMLVKRETMATMTIVAVATNAFGSIIVYSLKTTNYTSVANACRIVDLLV